MVSPLRYRNYGGYSRCVSFPVAPAPSRRHSHPLPKPKPKVLKSPNKSPRSPRSPSSPRSRSPALSPTDEESASDINAIHYEIHVITGDALWAGTDANVYITLCGTDGETGRKQLTKKYTNLFERGRTDCFDLKVKQDLGKLTLLHIEEDETGFGAAWLLERVEVVNMATQKKTMFLCGEWLDHEHGTDRYLLPEADQPPPDTEGSPPDGEREPPDGAGEASPCGGQPTIEITEPQGEAASPPDGEAAPDDGDNQSENTDSKPADENASEEPTDDERAPLVSTDSL